MEVIKVTSEALKGTNKAGVIKPDADGWYEVILGALEYPNSYGAVYREEPAREILNGDSIFVRRLKKGMLYGELGHPRPMPGWTEQQYMGRLLDIYEPNISHAIKDVVIDPNCEDTNGRKFIAFRGKVKPIGPHAKVLEDMLKDPAINVAFSIRSFTRDKFVGGKLEKHFTTIITWDLVHEPGIDVATKVNSPSLECLYDRTVSKQVIEKIISEQKTYGNESSGVIQLAKEVIASITANSKSTSPSLISSRHTWMKKW